MRACSSGSATWRTAPVMRTLQPSDSASSTWSTSKETRSGGSTTSSEEKVVRKTTSPSTVRKLTGGSERHLAVDEHDATDTSRADQLPAGGLVDLVQHRPLGGRPVARGESLPAPVSPSTVVPSAEARRQSAAREGVADGDRSRLAR